MTILRLIALLLLSLLASCQAEPEPKLLGYLEADYVDMAAQVSGRLQSIVKRGNHLDIDAPLFQLEVEPESLQLLQLQAEVAANQGQQQAATATLKLSKLELARLNKMIKQQYISKSQLDQAHIAVEQAEATLNTLTAIGQSIEARIAQLQWVLRQKQQDAPVSAMVEDVFFQTGEWVAAGKPVVRLLPDDGLKLRFYLPETARSQLTIGQKVQCMIDGKQTPTTATVSFIADEAEFAPPMI